MPNRKKFEIRISKSETISNNQNSDVQRLSRRRVLIISFGFYVFLGYNLAGIVSGEN
jgi:hypothetical protein